MTFFLFRDHCILKTKSALPGTISSDYLFFLKNPAVSGEKVQYPEQFKVMTFFFRDHCILRAKSGLPGNHFKWWPLFFREINKNLGRKLILITMTLRLKVTISHKNFFQPVKYCMSHSLITHNIPIFMTRFWHANCMARLRGHCTLLKLTLYSFWFAFSNAPFFSISRIYVMHFLYRS